MVATSPQSVRLQEMFDTWVETFRRAGLPIELTGRVIEYGTGHQVLGRVRFGATTRTGKPYLTVIRVDGTLAPEIKLAVLIHEVTHYLSYMSGTASAYEKKYQHGQEFEAWFVTYRVVLMLAPAVSHYAFRSLEEARSHLAIMIPSFEAKDLERQAYPLIGAILYILKQADQ